MHEVLAAARKRLSLELPALDVAADRSLRQRDMAREFFVERLALGDQLDIVICGSMARQEMSAGSDFDYLIVAHNLVEDATKTRAFRRACDEWCDQRSIPRPGPTGIFGKVVSATELVEQIGLEFDTNRSLKRRILLIEEGVSVLAPALHRRFVKVALSRYVGAGAFDEHGVPRFLLNDVARYWRTIAVDYQAKVWERLDASGWALRYLKLRISRKLTFAGAVVPLMLVATRQPEDVRGFLLDQFVEMPPLARLAQLVDDMDEGDPGLEALRAILVVADRFTAALASKDDRVELERLEGALDAHECEVFESLREQSDALQAALESLFLDSHAIGRQGRKYLTF